MVKKIVMPKYGLQQDEGKVVRWLKNEGEKVEKGEGLVEVETDKAVFEYESPEAGVLRKILVTEGSVVPVLSVIAVVTDSPDEPVDVEVQAPVASEEPGAISGPSPPAPIQTSPAGRVKSSPAAKKLAKDLGVDLMTVVGTGPGGRITREDVEQAAAKGSLPAGASPGPSESRTPLSRMRQAIGQAMSESKGTIPHFYVSVEVDMTDLEAWRKKAAEAQGIQLSVTDLLIKAAAEALKGFPSLNASLDGDSMVIHEAVHVGLAVGTEEGLLVPVIPNVQAKSMNDLAKERADVVEAARSGKLKGSDRATFTISNLGMFGVKSFIAIVNPPESAALAVGAIRSEVKPFGDQESFAVRRVMEITLSADHRLADGVLAASYLRELKKHLESVQTLEGWL